MRQETCIHALAVLQLLISIIVILVWIFQYFESMHAYVSKTISYYNRSLITRFEEEFYNLFNQEP